MPRCINIYIFYTYILCSSIVNGHSQSESRGPLHYEMLKGLPAKMATSIFQDSKGFMWFGTENGLYRYDGTEFREFHYDPQDTTSIFGNMIMQILFEDRKGNIWIGTQAGGLNVYNPHTESFRHFSREPDYPFDYDFNMIHTGIQDHDGDFWFAGARSSGILHFDPSTGKHSVYIVNSDSPTTQENRVSFLAEDSKGRIWVGTYIGLFLFDKETGEFMKCDEFMPGSGNLENEVLTGFIEDPDGSFWISSGDAVYRYSEDKGEIIIYNYDHKDPNSLSDSPVLTILDNPLDNGRSLFVVTLSGLNLLDKSTGRVTRLNVEPDDHRNSFFRAMFDLYLDDQGTLWVASAYSGFNAIHLRPNPFVSYPVGPFDEGTATYEAGSFLEDSRGNIWIGTPTAGLLRYDREMNFKKRYTHDPADPSSLCYAFVFTLFEDSDANLWVGTAAALDRFDRKKEIFHHIELPMKVPLDFTRINDILEDKLGDLWFATGGFLFLLSREDRPDMKFTVVEELSVNLSDVRTIVEDSSGSLWFGTDGDGLFRLTPENRDGLKFEITKHDPQDSFSISADIIWDLYIDQDGIMWAGTSAGLNRFDPETETFTRFNKSNGLDANVVYYIVEDNNRDLWLSTEKGILRFKQTSDSTCRSKLLDLTDGIPFENNFHFKIYKNSDDRICVGARMSTGNGYYCFHPDSLKDNDHIPPIVLTQFVVNNKPFSSDSSVTAAKHFHLRYNQNFFSIRFAALDFINPEKNQYAYMLEGFDKEWIYSRNRNVAYYTNVPPGDYLFRVKGSNNDGTWNEEGVSLAITISPPPWKTWWAYSIYALVFIGLIFFLRRYDLKRQRLKQELELGQVEAEKLKEIDTMKSRFFANISHEFRTPLTLILGPLENIMKKTSDEETGQELSMVQRQAQRLLKLVNQLLNLSRLEAGKMTLQASEVNIVEPVKGFVNAFESLARQKNISLSIDISENEILVYVDVEKFEQIINNLMSNSLKFTGEKGQITVAIPPHPPLPVGGDGVAGGVQITVSDTGRGIPPDKLPHIFDRFYQADDSATRTQEGTGIGLALVKQLVELHQGTITVESEVGKGTTFTVVLPTGKEHLKEEELVQSTGHRAQGLEIHPPHPLTPSPQGEGEYPESGIRDPIHLTPDPSPAGEGSKSPCERREANLDSGVILIVEDNADLRSYMRKGLDLHYQVVEAVNGKDGVKKALEHIPDLVVSDVMMPEMDGNELCRKIKLDVRTSHIPVILLTAKASKESRMEGLQTGADDFMTKPFDQEELLVRIKNLIEQRNKLRELFSGSSEKRQIKSLGQFPDEHLGELDQKFLRKAVNVVELHLSDFDFSVEIFAQEMAVSRVQLHRKLKALTSFSASDLVRTIRLEHAAEMLRKGKGNVTEVAYETGFNNLSWFARCFQERYHVPPSEYGKKA